MAYPEEEGVLYALYPGYVHSQHDGDRHFIGARQLANLYGVPMHECVVMTEENMRRYRSYRGYLIPLFPRRDGNYSIATIIQEMPWD